MVTTKPTKSTKTLWWLSFADPYLPLGSQFLGAVIVPGNNLFEAVQTAHKLKLNPGGEVRGVPVLNHLVIPERWCNRLLTRLECEEFDKEMSPKVMN